MFFDEKDICQVVQNVCELVLHWSAEPRVDGLPETGDKVLAGSICVSGLWTGTITLFCFTDMARDAAGVMLDAAPESLASEDVLDAVGELTNMVGGNVRSLLPEPCELSLPQVSMHGDPGAIRAKIFMAMGFMAHRHTFWVALSHGDNRFA